MLVAFIGGGNMATALISGLQRLGRKDVSISVCDPDEKARQRLLATFGVTVLSDPGEAIADADVILIAVKPQVMPAVLDALEGHIEHGQLVLSVAAGIRVAAFEARLSPQQAVIRSMPNTPALIGEGVTGLFANAACRAHHREQAERILGAAGEVVWIPAESMMDAVTAVSGSGPAYFFLLAEALAEAGIALGLPREIARRLATSTCAGAGAMVKSSGAEIEDLRRRVTSPGGTTQAALETFESGGFRALVLAAARAAEERGQELSRTAG